MLNQTIVRDGVSYPPSSVEQTVILPGVEQAVQQLSKLDLPLIVVTNQPDVARGTQSRERVEQINRFLQDRLPLTAFYVCYHDTPDNCSCRKPLPGLLKQAASAYNIDLSRSFMVGDRWSDVVAGQSAGCRTLLIDLPHSKGDRCTADYRVRDLSEAVGIIVRELEKTLERETRMMPDVSKLRVKIFADGADRSGMLEMARKPHIAGLTTNPTLMRKAGISDYRAFAKDILQVIADKPISFEVFSDDFAEMERQANEIASWASNVYVKIPVTNCKSESACALIKRLAKARVKLNVTALLTLSQVSDVAAALGDDAPSYISVFAGRIADTGRDPLPLMSAALELMRPYATQELIWASPRELLNIFQADAIGCHIITVTHDVLKKLDLVGKDLATYSLETVKMFHNDAAAAGFVL